MVLKVEKNIMFSFIVQGKKRTSQKLREKSELDES
jgi:hypothetical protein